MRIPELGESVPSRGNDFTRWVGRTLLSLTGWRCLGEIPDLPKFVIVGAPHTSNWDFLYGMATIHALGIRLGWMGKHTLFRWPLGGIMRWLGGIPIDRRAQHGVVDQMVDEFARREQLVLVVTPEGTRKRVEAWKRGFYYIARGAGVPLLLAYPDYARKVVEIGPVVEPTGDVEADMARLQEHFRTVTPRRPENYGQSG